MIIGIDIDDTLTYLHDIKIKAAQDYIKKNKMPYMLVKKDANFLSDMFDWSNEECDKFWFQEADKMLSRVKAREFASDVIKRLKYAGHKILIITARNIDWHKDPYDLSLNWLNKNEILFDKLLVGHLDKTQVCVSEKVDIFIDDLPETLVKLQEVGIKTIMVANPHNIKQKIYNGRVVSDWHEIETIINDIITH